MKGISNYNQEFIIEEESILLSNILYNATVIVTFEVLSDHAMFWKHRYFPSHELKSVALDREEIEVFKPH